MLVETDRGTARVDRSSTGARAAGGISVFTAVSVARLPLGGPSCTTTTGGAPPTALGQCSTRTITNWSAGRFKNAA